LIPFINIHTHQIDVNYNIISITDWCTTTISQRSNLFLFSAGIHPWFINTINFDKQYQALKEQAIKTNCKAIGECGLDKLKGPDLSIQISIFELFAIIKKYQNQVVFIIHGFNQNPQIALQLLKLGAYLSFGNALLNVKNERLKYVFAQTPNHQLFIENDDAACKVEQIYEAAASIKKCELNVMKEIIFANYKTVFTHE